jgi:hypothetical protein
MTSGQALVVGVGLALILVIAVAVAAFVWREHVLDRRRSPEERYRRTVLDVRRVQTDLEREGDRRRAANRIRQTAAHREAREERSNRLGCIH